MPIAHGVGAIGVILSIVCLWMALSLPFAPRLSLSADPVDPVVLAELGGRMVEVRAIRSSAGSHALEPVDLIEEPDILPTWEEFFGFFERQSRLTEVLAGGQLELQTRSGQWLAAERHARGPLSLPWQFYLQVLIGLFIWAVGVATYVHSDRHDGARGYAASALGMGLVIWPAAVYSTRPLAMNGDLFRALSTIDHIGGIVFSVGILVMMVAYPTRLFRGGRWLWLFVPLGIAAEYWPVAPKKLSDFYAVMALHLMGLALTSAWQWRASRKDPVARAAFSWTILSVILGLATFVALIDVPYWLGLPTIASQAVSLSAISIMFAGISLGILRYRLFDIGRWWLRTWTWLIGGALVVAVDLLLISVSSLGEREATMITLAVVGWLYFPVRQWLFRRLSYRRAGDDPSDTELLVSAASSKELAATFERRLRQLFSPLRVTVEGDEIHECALDELGTALLVPRVTEPGHYYCYLRDNGHRLYSRDDLRTAVRLTTLVAAVDRALVARAQGAATERSRIRRDLHDDLGASIVRIIHSTHDANAQARAKEAMTDLRNILVALAPEPAGVRSALAAIEAELRQTLELAGGHLDWEIQGEADWILSARANANVVRILREATTNVVHHGDGNLSCRITAADDGLTVTLENAVRSAEGGSGQGLGNMSERIRELGGDLQVSADEQRFRLQLHLPQEAG